MKKIIKIFLVILSIIAFLITSALGLFYGGKFLLNKGIEESRELAEKADQKLKEEVMEWWGEKKKSRLKMWEKTEKRIEAECKNKPRNDPSDITCFVMRPYTPEEKRKIEENQAKWDKKMREDFEENSRKNKKFWEEQLDNSQVFGNKNK